MMEQMLKLCMFLRRAKLTFVEAIARRHRGCVRALCRLLWALHLLHQNVQSRIKKDAQTY